MQAEAEADNFRGFPQGLRSCLPHSQLRRGLTPKYMPMVIEPRPWTGTKTGGYLSLDEKVGLTTFGARVVSRHTFMPAYVACLRCLPARLPAGLLACLPVRPPARPLARPPARPPACLPTCLFL